MSSPAHWPPAKRLARTRPCSPREQCQSALHAIQHSEFIVVQEGTLEFDHDGKAERAGPGSIIYVAFGTVHSVKNMGDGPAKYVVIQVGGDTKK